MKPISAVPMIALTRSQDNVEAINKALRNAGHPVHVTWLPDARDLGDVLTQASAEMLMLFADEGIVDLSSARKVTIRTLPRLNRLARMEIGSASCRERVYRYV